MSTVSPGSNLDNNEASTSLDLPDGLTKIIDSSEETNIETLADSATPTGKKLDDLDGNIIDIDLNESVSALSPERETPERETFNVQTDSNESPADLTEIDHNDLDGAPENTTLASDPKLEHTLDNKPTTNSIDEHPDIDFDFDPSYFSIENLKLLKDKDGKNSFNELSFPMLDEEGDEFKQEFLENGKDSMNGMSKDSTHDIFNSKLDGLEDLNDLKEDDIFSQNIETLERLSRDDLFKHKLGDLKDVMFKDDEQQNIFNNLRKSHDKLIREVNETLSNDNVPDLEDLKLDQPSGKFSNGSPLTIDDFGMDSAINSLNNGSDNHELLLFTPRQANRAQSEALETHIQKPKLQAHPASVPQSPTKTNMPPSNTFFLPRSLSSPLSKRASGSPTSKKVSQLSKIVQSDKSSMLQAINGAMSEQTDVSYIQSDETPRVSAYARLDFPSFTFYVQTLQVILGRGAENGTGMVDVDLGPVKAISRRHAKIFYNFGTQRFELSILGRNGAFVDNTFIDIGSTVPLKDAYVSMLLKT